MRLTTLTTILALAAATPGLARPPLSQVKEIDDGLFAVALALEISDECDRIAARTLRGLSYLRDLKSRASALGYSDDEIEAHVKSRTEKARMRAKGEAYVRAQGLDPRKPDDLCTLGRQEIAKGSQTGTLLRLK